VLLLAAWHNRLQYPCGSSAQVAKNCTVAISPERIFESVNASEIPVARRVEASIDNIYLYLPQIIRLTNAGLAPKGR